MKIASIVGARPQFIKASPISRRIRRNHHELLIHTGQHYDKNLSDIFFSELGLPHPDYNLQVGSASHGQQTGLMLSGLENILIEEHPDFVIVFGDTNSTLAAALAAVKLNIPIAHVEAGLRSYNRHMPEEINRLLTDHVSDLLFCPSRQAVRNLQQEGITHHVYQVGDVMMDALQDTLENAHQDVSILARLALQPKKYILATIHRAENTDDPLRLNSILAGLSQTQEKVVIPLHPRTRQALPSELFQKVNTNLLFIEPVGYLDMVRLESWARLILTDSGGVQKEAYWLEIPCITLRDETEWVETVQAGWNILVGANKENILHAIQNFTPPQSHPVLYGDGQASERCVNLIEQGI